MLGHIADKLSNTILKVSTGLDHFGTFLVADEPLDVTSPNYAKWKYRIQHTVGKKVYRIRLTGQFIYYDL